MQTLYKVENPLDKDLTILKDGVTYTLPANGTLTKIPSSVAKFWGEQVHAFLKFEEMPKSSVEIEEEVKPEVVEEPVIADVKEEEVIVEKKVVSKKIKK